VTDHTRVILLNAVPLLAVAATAVGLAVALARLAALSRGGTPRVLGTLATVLAALGVLAGVLGALKIDDDFALGGGSPWPTFAGAVVALGALLLVPVRWGDLAALARTGEPESQALGLRGADTADDVFEAFFGELESLGIEAALLFEVEGEHDRVRALASWGVDGAADIVLDVRDAPGGIASALRERNPHAVYDAASAPGPTGTLARRLGARSLAFVPVVGGGGVPAALVAATTTAPRLFGAHDLERLERIGREAARALERVRTADALADARGRGRLVREIARKVREEVDVDAVVRVAVEETAAALGVERAFVRLGGPGEPMPIAAEWVAAGVERLGDATALPASNLAARERRTVLVPDVREAAELDAHSPGGRDDLLALGTRAVLATPLVVFDRLIGTFALHHLEPHDWTEGEVELAEAVAGEAAMALHTARLLVENRHRLERQASLLSVAQTLASDLRFESVLRRLVDDVVELVGGDSARCWIFDRDRARLVCRAVYGLPADLVGEEVRLEPAELAGLAEEPRARIDRGGEAVRNPLAPGMDRVIQAPIIWLGELRGILTVGSSAPDHDLDAADLELIEGFAQLAALALHNAESFEAGERQARIQRGFFRVAEALGSPLSLGETFGALARAAAEALGGASAFVLRGETGPLRLAGAYDLPGALETALGELDQQTGEPFRLAASEERVIVSTALADDERFDEAWRSAVVETGYGALVAAPVLPERGARHVVVVLFRGPRPFSDEDLALARHLTRAARGALERSELFETERRARNLSQRLAATVARLAATLDPDRILADVVQEALVLLEADAAAIRELEGEELVVRATAGGSAVGAAGSRSGSGTGLAGDVAQSRATVALADAREEPRLARGDALLGRSMVSCVGAPLVGHDRALLGVLAVYGAEPRSWRDDEVQALGALSTAAAAALSNAELYQRVAEEKERNDAILGNIADGIVAVGRDGKIVLWNAMAERITGVPMSEALGRLVGEVLQRELTAGRGDAPGERQVPILRGGKEVWLSLTEAVMLDPAGGVAGRIFAFRDVSGERLVEQMKSDFVSTVSHELRTPLTSIYGFAETLLRRDVAFGAEERATFLGYIASESERLIHIVDDLLDVAMLEAGTLGVSAASVDVGTLAAEVAARAEELAPRPVRFALDVSAGLVAQADPDKLRQILENLVDNAVKFSPEGGTIGIAARRRAATVEVRVSDEGSGIARSEQQRIFTKFYRSESAVQGHVQGTGLGLFLARGLIAAMGGRIWVESDEGKGATFAFDLPVSKDVPVGMEMAAGRT
jgi:PAS domain S-box-containing protein